MVVCAGAGEDVGDTVPWSMRLFGIEMSHMVGTGGLERSNSVQAAIVYLPPWRQPATQILRKGFQLGTLIMSEDRRGSIERIAVFSLLWSIPGSTFTPNEGGVVRLPLHAPPGQETEANAVGPNSWLVSIGRDTVMEVTS
ncbi:hypothetical protein BSR03_19390 [Serratia proteamaculans]|nr:hypothetical protein BSR03_19390 [Serratia proteamaculans]